MNSSHDPLDTAAKRCVVDAETLRDWREKLERGEALNINEQKLLFTVGTGVLLKPNSSFPLVDCPCDRDFYG